MTDFPPSTESSSRFVQQRQWAPESTEEPLVEKPQTWRRILLVQTLKEVDLALIPDTLLDELVEIVLFDKNTDTVHKFLSRFVADFSFRRGTDD